MYGIMPESVERKCPRCGKTYTTLVYGLWIPNKICPACDAAEKELKALRKKLREHREPTTHDYDKKWRI